MTVAKQRVEIKTAGHITRAVDAALEWADLTQVRVEVLFNGTPLIAYPGETPDKVGRRWQAIRGRYQRVCRGLHY